MMLSVKAKQEKPMVRKVSVKNNSSSKLPVWNDDGEAFSGQDWEYGRTPRTTIPVGMVSGNELVFVPEFASIPTLPELLPTAVKAEITIGTNTTTVVKRWDEIENGFSAGIPVPAGTVDFFDVNENPIRIKWFVRYNPGAWRNAGESLHEIYFLRGMPQTDLRQETLYWLACAGSARGKSKTEDLVNAIWSKFSTGSGPANTTRKKWHTPNLLGTGLGHTNAPNRNCVFKRRRCSMRNMGGFLLFRFTNAIYRCSS